MSGERQCARCGLVFLSVLARWGHEASVHAEPQPSREDAVRQVFEFIRARAEECRLDADWIEGLDNLRDVVLSAHGNETP